MSAIAIANTMGGPQVKAREEIYRSRAEKYSAKSWKSLRICCLRL